MRPRLFELERLELALEIAQQFLVALIHRQYYGFATEPVIPAEPSEFGESDEGQDDADGLAPGPGPAFEPTAVAGLASQLDLLYDLLNTDPASVIAEVPELLRPVLHEMLRTPTDDLSPLARLAHKSNVAAVRAAVEACSAGRVRHRRSRTSRARLMYRSLGGLVARAVVVAGISVLSALVVVYVMRR